MAKPVYDLSKTYFGQQQATKIAQLINEGSSETPDTTAVVVLEKTEGGLVSKCYGETVPTDEESGFAKGCEFLDTNATEGDLPVYLNTGDEEGCAFVQLGVVNIPEGSIDTEELADDAVTNDKMADDSVDTDELVDDSVTQEKIGDEAVGADQMEDESFTTDEFPTSLDMKAANKSINLLEDDKKQEVTADFIPVVHAADADSNAKVAFGANWAANSIGGHLVGDDMDHDLGLTSDGGRSCYFRSKPFVEVETTVKYNADPSTNLDATQVYLDLPPFIRSYYGEGSFIGGFISANNGNALSFFGLEDGDKFPVVDDSGASIPVFVKLNEGMAELYATNPYAPLDIFVPSVDKGRYIQIHHSADPAGEGAIPLYFDDNGATLKERLVAVFLDTTDHALETKSKDGFQKFEGEEIIDLYFDEDAAEGQKLLHESSAGGGNLIIPFTDGRMLEVIYSATASTDGVPVYYDEVAAELQFVSPTTTNGQIDLASDKVLINPVKEATV